MELLFVLTTLYRQAHSVCVGFTIHFVFQAHTSPSVLLSPHGLEACPSLIAIHKVRLLLLTCCHLSWESAVVQKCLRTVLKLFLQTAYESMQCGSLCFQQPASVLVTVWCMKLVSAVISVNVASTPSCPLTWSCEWCYEMKGWSFSVRVTCIVVAAHWSRY